MDEPRVAIAYFSDILCVWAYAAQIRLDELRRNFGEQVEIVPRFVAVFGSTRARVDDRWRERGGRAAYARHVREVAARFDHVQVHPEVWTRDVPAGSHGVHAFVKAAALLDDDGDLDTGTTVAGGGRGLVEELAWRLRLAFFRDVENVARIDVQQRVAEAMGLPGEAIRARIEDGSALAALSEDYDDAAAGQVTGSPTWLLNEGRQKLYGNVGYRIVEANVQELLRDDGERASWC